MMPYDTYSNVALPWLQKMPSHWELLRNKNFLRESKETVGDDSALYTLLSLTLNGIIREISPAERASFPRTFLHIKRLFRETWLFVCSI